MSIKNKNISKANPNAIANDGFINALYQEAYQRDATLNELAKFNTRTVKDASNIILGAKNSPFSNKSNNKPKPTSENKPMLTMKEANDPKYWKNGIYVGPNNQENKTEEATLYKEGNEPEIVEVGSEKASELQKDGYTLNNKVEEKVEEKIIEDETDNGGTVDLSMYQNMIDNSIVLTELFNNPA